MFLGAIVQVLSGAQPEIRNGEAVLKVWGPSPQPPEINGGLGAKPPAARGWGSWGKDSARKVCIFWQK